MLLVDGGLSESPAPDQREQMHMLLLREAELLDNADYDPWLALFTGDGVYWVPARPGQEDRRGEVSLFHDDHAAMRMRIERLRHPRAHGLDMPVRTSHALSQPVLIGRGSRDNEYRVRTRFTMAEYQADRRRHFAGCYIHTLREEGGAFRIALKRVDLVDCEGVFEPLQVFI